MSWVFLVSVKTRSFPFKVLFFYFDLSLWVSPTVSFTVLRKTNANEMHQI